jgi:hypothetical protein
MNLFCNSRELGALATCEVTGIPSYPTPAKRPAFFIG